MVSKIELTKSLPREQWGEFFDQFSDGNRGRHISIESIDPELGDQVLIQNAPLLAIVSDRPGKGDDLVIEVGKDEVTYAHTIALRASLCLYPIVMTRSIGWKQGDDMNVLPSKLRR